MNDPDAQGAGPEPAQNAVPPQQPPQPPNPPFVQPPPGIGDESNYRAFYTDQSKDPHQGAYKVIMAEFNVPLGQAPPAVFTPQQLATRVYQSGDQGLNMSFVLHCRPANTPDAAPGYVNVYHRVSRFAPRIGMLPTPWDDVAFAFQGDVVQQQAPPSVVWDQSYFHTVVQLIRVPTVIMMDQLLGQDPNSQFVGPFGEDDAGTEVVRTRRATVVPHRYVQLLLAQSLTPREAWIRVKGAIAAAGQMADCSPLIDWLRVALTRADADQPSRLCVEYPSQPILQQPSDMNLLTAHRLALVKRDLPTLSPDVVHQGSQHIASSLGHLVAEQRLARQEETARRTREATKTPDTYFGSSLVTLLRWNQVATGAELPRLWQQLAKAPKGQHRQVVQRAVDETIETLQYSGMRLLISAVTAKKVVSLDWKVYDDDDLSSGLHPFSVGYVSVEEANQQSRANHISDMMYSGDAAPSLADTQAVLSSTSDIHIPVTTLQARITLQRFLVLLYALLGNQHSLVQAFASFYDQFMQREPELVRAHPRVQEHRHIVPALLVRWAQLRVSYWFQTQAHQNQMVAPPDFSELFKLIALNEEWSPHFPSHYMQLAASYTPGVAPAERPPSAIPPPAAAPPPASDNSMIANIHYKGNLFDRFKAMNLKTREVLESANTRANPQPLSSDGTTRMCLSYHLKGLCNGRCGRRADHERHSDQQDQKLKEWANAHYKVPEGTE